MNRANVLTTPMVVRWPRTRIVLRRTLFYALRLIPQKAFEPVRLSFPGAPSGSLKEKAMSGFLKVARHRGLPSDLGSFTLTDNPAISITNRESFIVERLYWFGEKKGYEPEVLKWWLRHCARATNILELGANIGYFTVQGAKANPAARYTAVEPHPGAVRSCRDNLRLNGLESVTVVEAAAVARVETPTIKLYLPGGRDHYADAPCTGFAGANEMHRPEAEPIDTYKTVEVPAVEIAGLMGGVDLLKIDVEGLEHELLSSVEDVLRESRPTIFLEMLDNTTQLRQFLADLCSSSPYRCFILQESGLLPLSPEQMASTSLGAHGTRDLVLTCELP
jgi:FkbM family methyltransferase